MIGAATPMVSCPGVSAIVTEPAHMRSTESVSPAFRPWRSAKTPIHHAPSGRITKPTANTAAVPRSSDVGSVAGKNLGAK